MKYELTFYSLSDKDSTIDRITVDAKDEESAVKKAKEGILSRPRFIAIKEMPFDSRVHLDEGEENIVKEVFQNAHEAICKEIEDNDHLDKAERQYSKNRIIVRLSEMFDNEVETN